MAFLKLSFLSVGLTSNVSFQSFALNISVAVFDRPLQLFFDESATPCPRSPSHIRTRIKNVREFKEFKFLFLLEVGKIFSRFSSISLFNSSNYCFASEKEKKRVSIFAHINRFVPVNEGHLHVPQVQEAFIIFIKFA